MKKFCFTLILLWVLTGCISKNIDSQLPNNPLVPRPDEIYVGTPKYITRVKGDSPWFNSFWTIADKALKATKKTTRPAGIRLFEMSGTGNKEIPDEKCGRFLIYLPFLPNPLKEGETVLTKATVAKGDEESSVFMVLWYRKLGDIKIEDESLKGSHLEEVKKLGYPITSDGTHKVRQIMFEQPKLFKSPNNSYMLMLQGTEKVIINKGLDYYYGGVAYDRHIIDESKYFLQKELVNTYEKFREEEVEINENKR